MLIRFLDRLADHVVLNLSYHLSQHTPKEKDSKQAAGVTIFHAVADQGKGKFSILCGYIRLIGEPRWGILPRQVKALFTQKDN